jgi:tetratricopeptide (TPR) repeat protein
MIAALVALALVLGADGPVRAEGRPASLAQTRPVRAVPAPPTPSAPTRAAPETQSPPRVLVMPFENLRREGRIFWLTEAAAVLLTDDLNALGANAITRQQRQQAFERLQVPPAAALTDATVIRIGQLVGATEVVLGSLQLDTDTLVVRARSITLDTGRVRTDITVRGPLQDLFPTFERIARQIWPSPKSSADIERLHPPIAVFENFVKGLLAETPATAINYLNTALKMEPGFDRARLALWDAYVEQGDHARALAAVAPVSKDSPWARRARFLAGLSQLALKKYDDAFATFRALADAQATPTVLNNLGVVQLRRGSTPETGQPTYYFTKAAEADPDDPDYVFNLGYAYWQDRDPQAAIYWLREVVRRSPTDGDAHFVLGAALAAAGNAVEATREKELAKRLSSTYEQRPGADVPKGLERVKSEVELPRAHRLETQILSTEQRDQAELAKFYLDRGRRLFDQENDRDASVELDRALYLSPYLADAHLLLGRIHLRNGRVHQAIDAFKIALWSTETAAAHAALGEAYRQTNNVAAARAEAERALALDPASTEAKQLIARLDGR